MEADVSFYGLPSNVKESIERHKGVSKLYEWQDECLNLAMSVNDKNLIFSVPTSGGKTLVAEILILKKILLEKKNVVFILPYISLVQEKVSSLSPIAMEMRFLLEEYAAGKGAYPPAKRRTKNSLYVCTIEKGMGLVNSLIENDRLNEIGLVVVDELHLIGTEKRGALLESTLIKIKHFNIRIVGMSATIGNLKDLAGFLEAEIFTKNFRPVELKEYIKIDDHLFTVSHKEENALQFVAKMENWNNTRNLDPDGVSSLVKEVTPTHSCLVFCQTKKNAENVACVLVNSMRSSNCQYIIKYKRKEKEDLLYALSIEGVGSLHPVLKKTVPFGVAFHHSGLTPAERKLLEEAYMTGAISCICCTSTLAAGVNLPARRVIIRSPYVGPEFLTLSRYKQMVGRAGRAGFDTGEGAIGESYTICQKIDVERLTGMLTSAMDTCISQMSDVELQNFILSAFHLGLANSESQVLLLVQKSFLKMTQTDGELALKVREAIQSLCDVGALSINSENTVNMSDLGKALAQANVSIDSGLVLFENLLKAQKQLILTCDLHLVYLVTPALDSFTIRPEYSALQTLHSELTEEELHVSRTIGISDSALIKYSTMGYCKSLSREKMQKFFVSYLIWKVMNGMSITMVSTKFGIEQGTLYNIILQTALFTGSVTKFCEGIACLWGFAKLFSVLPERLNSCASPELITLMDLPAVKMGRARQLQAAGFRTIIDISKSTPAHLSSVIRHLPLKQAKQIIDVAKMKVFSKYTELQEEAVDYHTALLDVGFVDTDNTMDFSVVF